MTAADAADATPNVGDFQLFRYEGGATTITSNSNIANFHEFRHFQNTRISEEPRSVEFSSNSNTGWYRLC